MADISDEAGGWPVRASRVLVKGRIVTVRSDTVELPDGELVDREVVEHPGAVAVLALDEQDRVLMIRQYRHPAAATLWEIPAGLRDVAGEPLLETARRELLEEAGYRAGTWHILADYLSSPGITTERLRIFLATDLTMVPAGQREYVRQARGGLPDSGLGPASGGSPGGAGGRPAQRRRDCGYLVRVCGSERRFQGTSSAQ